MIRLDQEIRNIKNYIVLQEYRYPDRFEVEYEYEEDVLSCEVPNVLLQPIVENAIFHGLLGKMEKGKLNIILRRQKNDLYILVIDNGVGMDKEKVGDLLKREENIDGEMRQIGIANVCGRIKQIYGKTYGIKINSELDRGTCVEIKVPYCRDIFYKDN